MMALVYSVHTLDPVSFGIVVLEVLAAKLLYDVIKYGVSKLPF